MKKNKQASQFILENLGQTEAPNQDRYTQVLILGAGASGLFCARVAGKRGKKVLVIDHANKAGKKILMSGGGRCNFTNYFVDSGRFISQNPHFCKSALSRYPSWEFISLVEKYGILYHEREHGQLFCKNSSKDILEMLLEECARAKVQILLNTSVLGVQSLGIGQADMDLNSYSHAYRFVVQTSAGRIFCESLVVATGGLSIPSMGASGLGYQIAEQFGHRIVPVQAGLVPFVFTDEVGRLAASLAGVSHLVVAFNDRASFRLPLLFTHRGLSGPAMLQLSNYWRLGESIFINLLPDLNVDEWLLAQKKQFPKQRLRTVLAPFFAKNLLLALQAFFWADWQEVALANIKDEDLLTLAASLNCWQLKPSATEGYRTAEVTLGGVATDKVSSKTFESQLHSGLYFIGEVLDVTGQLGGFNFQWAWASAFACGSAL